MSDPDFLKLRKRKHKIAYRLREGRDPTLVFLPGYASDMEGAKATALDALAERQGLGLLRFDYSGTGSSEGEFASADFAGWVDEALGAIDTLTKGPLIVIGSSMGGWIALHLALERTARVAGLIGVAAAPDFTQWGLTEGQKQVIAREGLLEEDNPYGPEPSRVYRDFWNSAQAMRLLEHPIDYDGPVRLIHGEDDDEVPVDIALRLMKQLRSTDVQLQLIKGGGHRLSEPTEIAAILGAVSVMVERLQ
jgi:pimeloyl-ACP methyl ester carboxylesterase